MIKQGLHLIHADDDSSIMAEVDIEHTTIWEEIGDKKTTYKVPTFYLDTLMSVAYEN